MGACATKPLEFVKPVNDGRKRVTVAGRDVVMPIGNHFETKEQLVDALRAAGLEKCNLLFAIDFTKSNIWQGENTYNDKCLHAVDAKNEMHGADQYQPAAVPASAPPAYSTNIGEQEGLPGGMSLKRTITRTVTFTGESKDDDETRRVLATLNPYQRVMAIAGDQLDPFDDDGYIPTVIFGHGRRKGDPYIKQIGPASATGAADCYKVAGVLDASATGAADCYKVAGVLDAYAHAAQTERFSGNTQFQPVIDWAINIVCKEMDYHILVIIGDGCINDLNETQAALARASKYPLSVIFVGVGDGSNPKNHRDRWRDMRTLDDLPTGDVDNWQSVYMSNMKDVLDRAPNPSVELATWMLMEVPEQYKYFKSRGLIRS